MTISELNSKLIPFIEEKAKRAGVTLEEYLLSTDTRYCIDDTFGPMFCNNNTSNYRVFNTMDEAVVARDKAKPWFTIITETQAIDFLNNRYKPLVDAKCSSVLKSSVSYSDTDTVVFTL